MYSLRSLSASEKLASSEISLRGSSPSFVLETAASNVPSSGVHGIDGYNHDKALDRHQSTRQASQSIINETVPSTVTNQTAFKDWLCSLLDTDPVTLTLSENRPEHAWKLPDCFNHKSTHRIDLRGGFIIESFSIFSYVSLRLDGVIFSPNNTSNSTLHGFNEDGSVNWIQVLRSPTIAPVWASFVVISNTNLEGSLPTTLPSFINTFEVSNCPGISGTIPPALFSNSTATALTKLSFTATNCSLTGSIPSALFHAQLPSSLIFKVGRNELSGTLASHSFYDYMMVSRNFTLDLSHNQLTGGFYDESLPRIDAASEPAVQISIDLSHNQLSGQIPYNFFGQKPFGAGMRISDSLTLNLSNNRLNGTLSSLLFTDLFNSSMTSFVLDVSSNLLNGTLPISLRDELPENVTLVSINLGQNNFSGELLDFCQTSALMTLDFQHNNFEGTIPQQWNNSCGLSFINLDFNPSLIGTLPHGLFNNLHLPSATFSASGTGLNGTMPPFDRQFHTLNLDHTGIDFCSTTPTNLNMVAEVECTLMYTFASQCGSKYPGCSTGHGNPIEAPSKPCPPQTRPSLDFTCIDGIWTAYNITTTIVIPPGAGIVIVDGNVSSSSIVFNGTSSTLTISGCANNLTSVVVDLTPSDIEKLEKSKKVYQSLIVLSGSNGTISSSSCILSNSIGINTVAKGSGCKKVRTEKAISSDGKSLGAYFTLDSSGCNRWWIIMVSVVCAVVLVGTVAAVVGYVLWQKHLQKGYAKKLAAN